MIMVKFRVTFRFEFRVCIFIKDPVRFLVSFSELKTMALLHELQVNVISIL